MSQTRAQLVKGLSNTSGSDDAIIVNSSGNVAIGATVASTRLDVEGNGVPVEINSANSNSNKVQLSDAGTVRGFFGASSSASFLVSGDGGSEQFRVQAAGGISFNGDTTAVNALDDYEEGEFVPTLTDGSSTLTLDGSINTLAYTKIGRVCYIIGRVRVTGLGGMTGNPNITNLPFPAASLTDQSGYSMLHMYVYNFDYQSDAMGPVMAEIAPGLSRADPHYIRDDATWTPPPASSYDNGNVYLHFNGQYFTS